MTMARFRLNPSIWMCGVCMLAFGARPARAAEMSGWYAFEPSNTPAPGEIGMQDWLERPAGRHGRIERKADKLYYHGKPVKLWGLNLCYSACMPDRKLAEKRAAFYPKYGINSVRLHKYVDGSGWAGIQSANTWTNATSCRWVTPGIGTPPN